MRIGINLASRPFADIGPALKRLRIVMGVLALVAIALGLGLRALHQKAEEARAREHSLDEQIAKINAERQGYRNLMRQPDNAQTLAHAKLLNTLFDDKSFSWTLAMEDLETVLPGNVQVVTIEPTTKDGHITLRLRVIGPRDKAVDLVRNLEHSRHFILPRIVGETSESATGPNERPEPVSASSRVNFELLADYNVAAEETGRRPERPKPTADEATPRNQTPQPAPDLPSAGRARRPYTGGSRVPSAPHAGGPQ